MFLITHQEVTILDKNIHESTTLFTLFGKINVILILSTHFHKPHHSDVSYNSSRIFDF